LRASKAPLHRNLPRPALGYGVAVVAVMGALLLRFILDTWLGPNVPYLSFFPAILVASWFGGLGPGVLAAVLSTLSAYAWLLPPPGLWKTPAVHDLNSLALFTLIGIGIAYRSGAMKKAEAADRAAAG